MLLKENLDEVGDIEELKNNLIEFQGNEEPDQIYKNHEFMSKISKEDISIVKIDANNSFLKLNEMLEISEEIIDSNDKENGLLSKISQEEIDIVKMDVKDSFLKFDETEESEEMIKYYDKGTNMREISQEENEEEKEEEKENEEEISVKIDNAFILKSIETLSESEKSDLGKEFSYYSNEKEENLAITKAQELSKEKVSYDVKKNIDANEYSESKESPDNEMLVLEVKERNMEMSHNDETVIEKTSNRLLNKNSNPPSGASQNKELYVDLITPNTTFESVNNRSLNLKDNNSAILSLGEVNGVCSHYNCTKLGLILSIIFFFVGYFLHNYIQISISRLSGVTNKPNSK